MYTPQGGRKDLRNLWKERILNEISVDLSTPVVCAGLTHGLSIAADLFVDSETSVLLPGPRWGNYDLIFETRAQGNIIGYQSMAGSSERPSDWKFNIEGLSTAIEKTDGKSLLVLNTPSNPGGYSPTWDEVDQIITVIKRAKGPMVIVLDEAYKGMEWEDGIVNTSLMEALSGLDPEKFLVMKIDGATKELFFFGGRVGFVSFEASQPVAAVLEEKVISCIRSTVSALSSPSQALVVAALTSPHLDQEVVAIRSMLRERYRVLKHAIQQSDLVAWPFNAAFFVMIHTPKGAEKTRLALLNIGVGSVAVESVSSIRLSYSTVSVEEIPEMIRRIESIVCA